MDHAFAVIRKRISVRSYEAKPVNEETRRKLEQLFKQNERGPFGNAVRFKLLDTDDPGCRELRSHGTYGVIKGARLFILAAVMEGHRAMEDLGYCLEKIILEATAAGLATCWLAGTFRRSLFAARMDLGAGELLPAITPVGYPALEKTPVDRLFRYSARSRHRKPWSSLFFAADGFTPLAESAAGVYRRALEAVRLAPSASNRQPWRLILDQTGAWHFYLKENRFYNRALGKIRVQNIDLGIAMSHFDLVASESGLEGFWKECQPAPVFPELQYIVSWLPCSCSGG